jgi:CO dehydrogenase maturation factor
LRIAIAGKGGSGKTTLSGTLAALLAQRGRQVIAIDGDTNPNLAQTLGAAGEGDPPPAALPSDLLVRREDSAGNPVSELALPVEEILRRYGTVAPDGVQLLVMGRVEHAGAGCKCRAHSIARYLLGELLEYSDSAGDVVVDMEAGLEHLSRGTTRHVDLLLAVAEPYYRSMETARRVFELGGELGIRQVQLVANKVRGPVDEEAIRSYAERHGLVLAGEVPYDEAVIEAERTGRTLLQAAGPDTPAVRAIDQVVQSLTAA